MNPIVIAPSILSADFARLGEEVKAVETAGADWIHFDVMDHHFVPNLTFGPQVMKAIKPWTKLPLDVHLMVSPVDALVESFAAAGADLISVHAEAATHLDRTLSLIRSHGKKAGVALNPATPASALQWVMGKLDLIVIMTVNPGFGGQAFIPEMLDKIRDVRAMIKASGKPIRLEVDGGVSPKTVGDIAAAGADTLVAGSAVFGATSYAEAIGSIRAGAMQARTKAV